MKKNKFRIEVLIGALKGHKYSANRMSDGFYECDMEFGLVYYAENEIKVL